MRISFLSVYIVFREIIGLIKWLIRTVHKKVVREKKWATYTLRDISYSSLRINVYTFIKYIPPHRTYITFSANPIEFCAFIWCNNLSRLNI